MNIKVIIPSALRNITKNQAEVLADGTLIRDVIENLDLQYPGFSKKLYNEQGKLNGFIALFLNDIDIRFLQDDMTPVADNDELVIISAISGG